ncbi:hypothetical protein ACFX2I_021020 [Malus domestica]|uniref:Germin-like protein n=2 Tax=Malus TaxID=3749 RepID=A0A498HEC8_MALDO|nr:hypothetical protein DVH24_007082 [Malus domestica]TQD69217.1 hypothetical protein C1H46_045250 [Malus baccata]
MNTINYLFLQLFLNLALFGRAKSDPDPLQDYCVADPETPQTFSLNGAPCIDPNLAISSHFTTSVLSKPGDTKANGFNVTLTNPFNLPGLNTLGLTMARIDIDANGIVPPHLHPRASEVTICLTGFLLVGFVDTSNRVFTQQLRPGESFVFPKGLVHFLYNYDSEEPAVALAGLGSQNPGAQIVSMASFTSEPSNPVEILKKGFQISDLNAAWIRRNLGG